LPGPYTDDDDEAGDHATNGITVVNVLALDQPKGGGAPYGMKRMSPLKRVAYDVEG
jgi:hypothetical protein